MFWLYFTLWLDLTGDYLNNTSLYFLNCHAATNWYWHRNGSEDTWRFYEYLD